MASLINALQPTQVLTRKLMLDEGPIDLTVVRREFRPWSAEWPAMSSKGKGYWIDFGGSVTLLGDV